MTRILVALVLAAACRQPPTVSAVHFPAERGSVLITAVDSATGDFIGALSGQLRAGSLVTFASASAIGDTLRFLNIPTGTYQVIVRRIGFKIDTVPAVITSNGAQVIQIKLPVRKLRTDELWGVQRKWWKFWRR